MQEKQTSEGYLDSLKGQINAMDPVERMCATVLVTLGRIVAELMNRRDWKAIAEMEKVCVELFREAKRSKDETVQTIQ